jgi:hypothetical protein
MPIMMVNYTAIVQHVEAHLAECELCQAELESLESLSDLLHEVRAPEFTSAERFAAQVNLRLPISGQSQETD